MEGSLSLIHLKNNFQYNLWVCIHALQLRICDEVKASLDEGGFFITLGMENKKITMKIDPIWSWIKSFGDIVKYNTHTKLRWSVHQKEGKDKIYGGYSHFIERLTWSGITWGSQGCKVLQQIPRNGGILEHYKRGPCHDKPATSTSMKFSRLKYCEPTELRKYETILAEIIISFWSKL